MKQNKRIVSCSLPPICKIHQNDRNKTLGTFKYINKFKPKTLPIFYQIFKFKALWWSEPLLANASAFGVVEPRVLKQDFKICIVAKYLSK